MERLPNENLADLVKTKFVQHRMEQRNTDTVAPVLRKAWPLNQVGFPTEKVVLTERADLQNRGRTNEATVLMNRILEASEADLKNPALWDVYERSLKWKDTSVETDMALFNALYSSVDARPSHLHVYVRHIGDSEVFNLVRRSLLEVPPPTKNMSLFRVTIKLSPESCLQNFLYFLESLYFSEPDVEIIEGVVTATRHESDGKERRMTTPEVFKFAELESYLFLGESAEWIGASARLGLAAKGRPHVEVRVSYRSERSTAARARVKNITLEQVVTPRNGCKKRVSFGTPELTAVHEYELPEGAEYSSLGTVYQSGNLIEYLQAVEQEVLGFPFFQDETTL